MHSEEWKRNWKKPVIEHNKITPWGWMVSYPEGLLLDERVDIGAFTYIQAHAGILIQDDVEIGSHCAIYSENTIDGTHGKIAIGRGACVGSHTTILPPVVIGAYAKVGAHSLVTKDIPPYELWAGVPAKFIKRLI